MKELAGLLFPDATQTIEDIEKMYPPRALPEGAKVTRMGPSPTGFIHLGNLYSAIVDERLARQSGGVFYLRIEDTDDKRRVDGAVELIISSLAFFGISFDEGVTIDGSIGEYGPYYQSKRKDIYHVFAKFLVEKGLAYPCFLNENELNAMREEQKGQKVNFGYYGKWAVCRDMPLEEVKERIDRGDSYVLRFRSVGQDGRSASITDGIRGVLTFQENFQDFVLLKSDGIPTYHFAHVVDDHLMRTTHVVRGEEWLASLPMHVQLFDALGFKPPVYCHTAQLMKMDGASKRKLSKRLDPELALDYYVQAGYPPEVMWEYLMGVLNSNFEQWRMDNPDGTLTEFGFTTDKMSNSGALFDMAKLSDVGKEVISKMTADEVYDKMSAWLREYDEPFRSIFTRDAIYTKKALSIGRGVQKPRKDFATWQEARDFMTFYYNEYFSIEDACPENIENKTEIISRYTSVYDHSDDQSAWFDKVRALAVEFGYAAKPKDYKKEPELYKGHVGDISSLIRIALTGRLSSPDLWEICQVIGKDEVLRRLNSFTKL